MTIETDQINFCENKESRPDQGRSGSGKLINRPIRTSMVKATHKHTFLHDIKRSLSLHFPSKSSDTLYTHKTKRTSSFNAHTHFLSANNSSDYSICLF